MSLKNIIKGTSISIGLASVVLLSVIAIKIPNVFKDLLGFTSKPDTIIQSVPYFVNFGDLGTSDSSYKTQYFKYSNRSWYMSWGNHGSTNHTNQNDNFNMLLGWNSTKAPVYGGYSYVKEVMKNVPTVESSNYSYLIMDFDFNMNHLLEWSFSPFELLNFSTSNLYLIGSHNSGVSWDILDTIKGESLTYHSKLKFMNTEENLISRTTRYGLVLVSSNTSARIELDQFIVSRLSLA